MKKLSLMLLLTAVFSICIISCSKDDDNNVTISMEQLYGKWMAKEVLVDGKWYDVTVYPYTRFGMDITFYEGGKYYGSGYFGNGNGTYEVNGNVITTYVNGKVYCVYTVNSLSSNKANLTLRMGNDSMQIRAEKQ